MTEVGKIENAPETVAATPAAPATAPVVPATPKTRTNAAGATPQKKAVGGGIKRPAAAPKQPVAPAPEAKAATNPETPAPTTPAAIPAAPKKKKAAEANPVPAVDTAATKANEKFKQFGYKEGNILMKISPTKLIVEIDLTQRLGRSQSGKSEIIARTAGVAGMEIPGLPGKQLQVQCYDTGVKRKAAFDEIG